MILLKKFHVEWLVELAKYVWTAGLLSQTNNTDQKQCLCMKYVFHELMELGGYTIPYFH